MEIKPNRVIIVEGILIFAHPVLREMFDIKIFVETDADVRILRRALRDVELSLIHIYCRRSAPSGGGSGWSCRCRCRRRCR